MRTLVAVSLVGAIGCASGSGAAPMSSSGQAQQSLSVVGSSSSMSINPATGPNINNLDFAPDRIWRVLPAAFDSIGVPVTQIDPVQRVMGNPGFKIRQRIGTVALSRYVDCGTTQIGPNADSYDVYLTVLVQVRPSGTGSVITTNFESAARPITFAQDYSRCTSRGSLEAKLLAAIKAQLK